MQFTRRAAAAKSGLTSGMAFAIKNGPFTIGVLEFFDIHPINLNQQDKDFYEQVGLYISTLIAQKQSEAVARQIEDEYKIVLQHAYNAFVAINEASLITHWTIRATELFGWEQSEVLGKPLIDTIIPERFKDAHMKGLFRYMATNEGPVLNKRVRAPALCKDGKEIPVELMIFPIQTNTVRQFGAFIVDCSKEIKGPDIVLS